MKWYVAKLIVECRVGRAPAELWDEQLVLLRARNADGAYLAALKLGKAQETTYENSAGHKVRWKFKGLGDLQELLAKTIRSGTEVDSRLSRSGRPRISPKRKLTVFWTERKSAKDDARAIGWRPSSLCTAMNGWA